MNYFLTIGCLVAGGLAGRWLGWSGWWWLVVAVLLWLAYVAFVKARLMKELCLSIALGCLLAARMVMVLPEVGFKVSASARGEVNVSGVVDSQPQQSNRSLQVRLGQISVDGYNGQWQGRLQLSLPVHSDVGYGDRLSLRGIIKDVKELNPGYAEYLTTQQVYGTMVWPVIVARQAAKTDQDVVGWGIWIQEQSARRLERLLPQDLATFLLGITLGSERLLSDEFDVAFKVTGTSHIVVASGYNVGILMAMVVRLVSRWGKYAVLVSAGLLVSLFVVVSGVEASLVRASLMAGIALLAVMGGRQKQAGYCLVIAGLIMLLINPWWLYEASFQLSFMATLSLIMFQPLIAGYSDRVLPSWLSEMISSTVAAQVLVYPIIGVLFGTWSVVSLLTNTLVLWLIPWLMLGGFGLLVVSWVNQGLAQWLAYGIYPWLIYVRSAIVFTSKLPLASISLTITWWVVAAYYSLMAIIHHNINYEQTS